MAYVEFEDDASGVPPYLGGASRLGRVLVRYEAPLDPEGKGRVALGYLKPSGDVEWIHPVTGEKFMKSDQKWVYDLAEAAQLEKDEPDRFVKCKG
jgi:hypothetical protein